MSMDVFGRDPSEECGYRFRANVWTWGVLISQMEALCLDLLGFELLWKMKYNNGDGPTSAAVCQTMADRFEREIADCPHGIMFEQDLIRMTADGRYVSDEELRLNPALKTYSPFCADRAKLDQWVKFIRHCGGFAVW